MSEARAILIYGYAWGEEDTKPWLNCGTWEVLL